MAPTAFASAEHSAWDFASPVGEADGADGADDDGLGSAAGVDDEPPSQAVSAAAVTAPRTTARRRGTAATVGAVARRAGTGQNGLPCRRA